MRLPEVEEVTDRIPKGVVPAGRAFASWSLKECAVLLEPARLITTAEVKSASKDVHGSLVPE